MEAENKAQNELIEQLNRDLDRANEVSNIILLLYLQIKIAAQCTVFIFINEKQRLQALQEKVS